MDLEGANPANHSFRHQECVEDVEVRAEGFKVKFLATINRIREMRRHNQAERDRMRARWIQRGLQLEQKEKEWKREEEERKLEPLNDIDADIWNKMEPEIDLLMKGKESSYYDERVAKKTYRFDAYWARAGPFSQIIKFLQAQCFPCIDAPGDMYLDAIMDLNAIPHDIFINRYCKRPFMYTDEDSAKKLGIYDLWHGINVFTNNNYPPCQREEYSAWIDPRKLYRALDRVTQLFFGVDAKEIITFSYIEDLGDEKGEDFLKEIRKIPGEEEEEEDWDDDDEGESIEDWDDEEDDEEDEEESELGWDEEDDEEGLEEYWDEVP